MAYAFQTIVTKITKPNVQNMANAFQTLVTVNDIPQQIQQLQ